MDLNWSAERRYFCDIVKLFRGACGSKSCRSVYTPLVLVSSSFAELVDLNMHSMESLPKISASSSFAELVDLNYELIINNCHFSMSSSFAELVDLNYYNHFMIGSIYGQALSRSLWI